MATNRQRYSALIGKLNTYFLSKWSHDGGLAGNSRDKRKFVIEKGGKSYLMVERTHRGASGKFSTISIHVLNEKTGQLDFVKHVDSWEIGKLNPCKD